ncbi:MAG: hypothetical protein J6C46_01050 [Clostridia bacterium]|nr:hypothetical protein [Clostridia bacterium]
MDTQTLMIGMMSIMGAMLLLIIIAFVLIQRKNKKSGQAALRKSIEDTSKKKGLSKTAFYQKVYLSLATTPIIKRYLFKVRMRLELVGNDDEYNVRAAAGKSTLIAIIITVLASVFLMYINRESTFMMIVSLIGVLVVVESFTEMNVSKIEDKLLNQQLELFSEVRHAYHESNMVEEAIYDASLLEENEVNFQADKIYNVLIAPDPEMELEKYYDVAPNRFLKAFAGISYLTKEFGDRRVNDVSLYLKNMNNITQELQLEILKRQKIDYYFNSLSMIALAPILFIIPIKNWAQSNFASTASFYEGKGGYALQIFMLVLIFICYALLKKVKDNGDATRFRIRKDNPWQEKLYRIPIFERFIDKLMPKAGKKEYVKIRKLLKDSASGQKMEWFYVNRVVYAVAGFIVALILFNQLHSIAIENVLQSATTEEKVFGQMNASDLEKANALTTYDTYMIDQLQENNKLINAVRESTKAEAINLIKAELRKISNTLKSEEEMKKDAAKIFKQLLKRDPQARARKSHIQQAIFDAHIDYTRDDYTSSLVKKVIEIANDEDRNYLIEEDFVKGIEEINSIPLTEAQITANANRIYEKLAILTNEYIKWSEVVVAILVAYFMYYVPVLVLKFQVGMRKMDMEDEVMQFQTIILMLMYIERVSVEYIIEWLERFSNIFKEPLATCMNNYESGAWEALEQLKDDAPYKPFVRIVESLQSAVENVKITDAFDELETERNFFQEKRKDANERLINKKAKIGRLIGFAPMIVLFVGYLIGPLIIVSVFDMTEYFSQMSTMI